MRSRVSGPFAAIASLAVALHGEPRTEPGKMPVLFVKTSGHSAANADFILNTNEMSVQFRESEIAYRLNDAKEISIRFVGAAPVHAQGVDELGARINVFSGADPNRWQSGARTFSSVAYHNLWPGIEAVYSVNVHLKTEFQLEPGADPESVRWHIAGGDGVEKTSDGALIIHNGLRSLREDAPQVFEQSRATGELRPVSGGFRLLGNQMVGIEVGEYDHRNRLIFDPVIGFSTLFGGSGQTVATAVTTDMAGNVIVAGYTTSFDLAPNAAVLGTPQRTGAFVAKFSAQGNELMFCTYVGGTLDTRAFAVAVDRWNDIYIAGQTSAHDFPVHRAIQSTIRGTQDAFVTELTPSGSSLVFSTYLGGSDADQAYGIGVDRIGNVYVAGDTESANFPTLRPVQVSNAGGTDAFIAKLGVSGSSLIFSTYLGGAGNEHAAALSVDSTGAALVAGYTFSSDFPAVNAFQAHSGGNQDAFVAKLNPAGNSLEFSTFLGGSGGTPGLTESASSLALDSNNNVYVTGTTASSDFPVTAGALQPTNAGGILDAFICKFSASGKLGYSTYLGGTSADYALAIGVDVAGNAHVAGYTASTDFPIIRSTQPALKGQYDIFVASVNSAGSALIYSMLLGGSQTDAANAMAVDRFATVVIAGQSNSTDFPVSNAYQTTQHGAGSAVIARIPVGWKPTVFTAASAPEWSIDNVQQSQTQSFAFGHTGDIPISGDWTNSGKQCLGSFHAGTWYLDSNCDGVFDTGDRTFTFGQAGDLPVVGDWNGTGSVKAGLYRAGTFILDLSGHLSGNPTGQKDEQFLFGEATDIPVIGDWNHSGTSKVGVFRAGQWLVDTNGSFTINGPTRYYGQAGDLPIVGDWDGSGTSKAGFYRGGAFNLDYNGNWLTDSYGDMRIPFALPGQYGPAQYALILH